MAIPFTQYLLPHGRKKPISIERPPDIEALAQRFIDAGGWYDAEVLTTGEISLTAGLVVNDEPEDIEFQFAPNGPAVVKAVDRLVQASVKHLTGSASP